MRGSNGQMQGLDLVQRCNIFQRTDGNTGGTHERKAGKRVKGIDGQTSGSNTSLACSLSNFSVKTISTVTSSSETVCRHFGAARIAGRVSSVAFPIWDPRHPCREVQTDLPFRIVAAVALGTDPPQRLCRGSDRRPKRRGQGASITRGKESIRDYGGTTTMASFSSKIMQTFV